MSKKVGLVYNAFISYSHAADAGLAGQVVFGSAMQRRMRDPARLEEALVIEQAGLSPEEFNELQLTC